MPGKRILRWSVTALLIVASIFVVRAWAEAGGTADPAKSSKEPLVVRFYDVTALLAIQPNYPLEPDKNPIRVYEGYDPTKPPEFPAWGPEEIRGLKELVDPDSWTSNGGPASMEYFCGSLMINQTAPNHAKIEVLLQQLYKQFRDKPVVTIEADWVQLERKAAATLWASASSSSPREATAAALEKAGAKVLQHAVLSGPNGRISNVKCGHLSTYLADADPILGEGSVGPDLHISSVTSGPALQVHPFLSPDGKTVSLEIMAEYLELREMRQKPVDFGITGEAPNPVHLDVELPVIDIHQVQTAISIPVGKMMIVGESTGWPPDPEKVVCFVIRATVSK